MGSDDPLIVRHTLPVVRTLLPNVPEVSHEKTDQ
jgi:hypothetical protein